VNFLQVQLDTAIITGRIAMRIEQDKRDWLKQAIEQGRQELRKVCAEFIRERRAA
jgi:hypothetical protein